MPGFILTALLLFASLLWNITLGAAEIEGDTVFSALIQPDETAFEHLIIQTVRLPRVSAGALMGFALAVVGTIMQALTRNPLADSGILGINAGAAFAVAAMLTSATTFMLVFGDIRDVQQARVWLAGSVYVRNWEHVHTLAAWLSVLLPLAIFSARQLNILALGEEIATGRGLKVETQRLFLLIISVALAGVAVAVSGTIGFVGLVAPHITRRLTGPSHVGRIPIATLFGGALLVTADLIGRWVIAPSERPIGIVTALIGAPYFAYLLYKSRNG